MNSDQDAFGSSSGPPVPDATPSIWLDGAKRGDSQSLELLFRVYGPLVRKHYLRSVPAQERSDLTQEVFLTAFKELATFSKRVGNGPSFRPWLRKIAFLKVGNYIRTKRREGFTRGNSELEELMPGDGSPDTGDEVTEEDERTELVRAAFDEVASNFEPQTMEAVRRVVIGNEPVDVVAVALGMSTGAVRIAKSRVLGHLRQLLQNLGETLETTGD